MRQLTYLPVSCLTLALCATLSSGCATADHRSSDDAPAAEAVESKEDDARKLMELEKKLVVSQARLEVVEMQAASKKASAEVRLTKVRAELKLTEQELAKFVDDDMPVEISSGELNLRSSRDRVDEAAEELAQIELMYAEQDLNDKTAEFVVNRGKRQAERAATRLAIQEASFSTLTERELPMRRQRLELAVDAAQAGLAESEREIEIDERNQAIALLEARNQVESITHDLAEAKQ